MVHHQLYALGVGVVVKGGYVEVGVGGGGGGGGGVTKSNTKSFFPFRASPPNRCSTFDEELIHAVVGGEIDISSYILVVGTVMSVGICL